MMVPPSAAFIAFLDDLASHGEAERPSRAQPKGNLDNEAAHVAATVGLPDWLAPGMTQPMRKVRTRRPRVGRHA